MKIKIVLLCLLFGPALHAQQVSDTLFVPKLSQVSYPNGDGPVVAIDEAHHNFHTSQGRFRPFAMLLERDGFRVKPQRTSFSEASLKGVSILVIANALSARNDTVWTLPTPSAFEDQEIQAVQAWVKQGGSLFLIADHMPFPGCRRGEMDPIYFVTQTGD
jgi:hypothetical protein